MQKPIKPVEPIKPEEVFYFKKALGEIDIEDGMPVEDCINQIQNKLEGVNKEKHEDLSIFFDITNGCTCIIFQINDAVPNKAYKNQIKDYYKQMERYKSLSLRYERDLEKYNKQVKEKEEEAKRIKIEKAKKLLKENGVTEL